MLARLSEKNISLGEAMDGDLDLSAAEIAGMFSDPAWSARFPPILSITQAAELLQVPIETIRSWRSRGLLNCCSRRVGKHVRLFRDRFIAWAAGSVDVFSSKSKPTRRPQGRKEEQL